MSEGLPEQWLQQATRGLDPDVSRRVRQELEGHFEDAVEAYEAEGLPLSQAQQAALADLGDSRAVGAGLRDSHLAEARYLKALLVGLISPLLLPVLVLIPRTHLGDVVISLFVLLPAIYMMRSFGLLLRERYGFYQATFPVRLLCAALGGMLLFLLFMRLLFGGLFSQAIVSPPWPLLQWTAAATLLPVAVAMILLAERLAALADPLYGLLLPLRLMLWLSGFSLFATTVAVYLKLTPFIALFTVPSIVGFVLLGALLTLLFFRALYRPPLRA